MALIDNAKRHFRSFERHRIEVPEWADPDADAGAALPVIYSRAVTLDEKQRIATIAEQEGRIASLAHCLVMKAEDEQGKKVFTLEDKRALLKETDADVIARIVGVMMSTPSVKDMEKNSPGTPTSP